MSFIATLTAGTMILVWFGELISEYGLGNGISLLIFAGIVARIPINFAQSLFTVTDRTFINYIILVALAAIVVYAVVFINEAVRKVPVYYAKRIKGNRVYQGATNYLPLKLNQAEVLFLLCLDRLL